MLINGVDVKNFNGKLLKVDIQPSNIQVDKEWLKKSLVPIRIDQQITFKRISLEVGFKGQERDEILNNISNLIKLCPECDLKLDGYLSNYHAFLVSSDVRKTVSKTAYKLILELDGYKFGDIVTETLSHITSKTINVSGNTDTPAIVEITPSIDIIDIVVTGLGETFTIKNLTSSQKVIVDGESGLVTVNGLNKFHDFDGWKFPALKPGSNIIGASSSNAVITIKYKPRWI